ncbi:unnamed protein product [Chironomus riparius]|uniref:RING-type domain-containing protein n=1 Tax=Chironomus riparius TaxID=315576 RepID=A0A9N9WX18_9DIPT|nr:unnamed protein product [Chironomus riparius]
MPLECCICKELLLRQGSKTSTIPCGHVYHTQCLLDWIENSRTRNQGNCPICRRNFYLNKVIPLLTLDEIDGSTASAVNHFAELEQKHVETKNLLQGILDSLVNLNTMMTEIRERLPALGARSLSLSPSSSHVELKTREAIIESLKMHVERINKPQGIYYNQNCIDSGHSSNYDDSGLNAYVDDLDDDELEFNLSLN